MGNGEVFDFDISDLESLCIDTPEELCHSARKRSVMVNQVQILTTGGTIDKEYPRALGGYAFEFGQITAAHRITNRVNAKIEIERVCALDSQDMTDKERQIILRRINAKPHCAYVITHGTDTLVETAKYLTSFLKTGVVILTGAKLPEVFKDSDADFNLGVAIGFAQAIPVVNDRIVVKITIRGQLFDPDTIGRNENGEFYVTV